MRQVGSVPRWVWTLPILYVLWANIHVQFVYGLLLMVLALVAPWLDAQLFPGRRSFGENAPPPDSDPTPSLMVGPATDTAAVYGSRHYKHLLVLAALCAAATLVNPFGWRLYGVIVEYATQPGPFRWVNELKAPEFREPSDWVMLAMFAGACVALGRRTAASFAPLLLATAAVFAFRARRDLWFAVLASLYVLATAGPRHAPPKTSASPPAYAAALSFSWPRPC